MVNADLVKTLAIEPLLFNSTADQSSDSIRERNRTPLIGDCDIPDEINNNNNIVYSPM
jgi:hypothetical protein